MSRPLHSINAAWRKVVVPLVDSPFATDSETGFSIVLKKTDEKFVDGWLVKVTLVRPVPGVGVKWKLDTHSPVPLEHFEYFESLGGVFEDNQCSFELPPIKDFAFVFKHFFV